MRHSSQLFDQSCYLSRIEVTGVKDVFIKAQIAIRGEPFDMNIVPGMTFAIEITPINAEGTFGIFLSRSYVTTEDGHRCLTPYPLDEIIVA